MRGLGRFSLMSESVKLCGVLRMLNKSWRYAGESPVIILNINVALSFFLRVEKDTGTSVVTGPGNDPGSPILEFLEFVAQGNAKFIPNRAAIVKMGQLEVVLFSGNLELREISCSI